MEEESNRYRRCFSLLEGIFVARRYGTSQEYLQAEYGQHTCTKFDIRLAPTIWLCQATYHFTCDVISYARDCIHEIQTAFYGHVKKKSLEVRILRIYCALVISV